MPKASCKGTLNIKLLYIPASFALLWLEQYSLIINYFDNNQFAFIGSIIVKLKLGLGLLSMLYIMLIQWKE